MKTKEDARRLVPSETTWWILACGALLRVLFFFISVNNGGDALERAAATAALVQHPTGKLFFGTYLPGHFWMIAGATFLLRDTTLAGRFLSLTLGIASLWLVWVLSAALYDKKAADLSLFGFSFYSLHIAYSTTSSSEVPYLCFVLAGLACFFVYRSSNSLLVLALGGAALSVAASIRYEAWVIIFALTLVLLHLVWQQIRIRDCRRQLHSILLFGATAGSWPVFWMLYVWAKMGHPFFFVNQSSASVKEQLVSAHRSALYLLTLSPGVIVLTLSPLVVAASLYALFLRSPGHLGREFSVVLIIFGCVQSYTIVSGSLLPLARYTLSLGTLLAVVFGYGLRQMTRLFSPQAGRIVRIGVLATASVNLGILLIASERPNRYSDKFASISPRVRFPSYIQGVGDYLHKRLGVDDTIVFDNYNFDSNTLGAAAGLPLLPGDRIFTEASGDCSGLLEFMKRRQTRYVVYANSGTLEYCLPLSQPFPQPIVFAGMEFKCVFENKIYKVYEVTHKRQD